MCPHLCNLTTWICDISFVFCDSSKMLQLDYICRHCVLIFILKVPTWNIMKVVEFKISDVTFANLFFSEIKFAYQICPLLEHPCYFLLCFGVWKQIYYWTIQHLVWLLLSVCHTAVWTGALVWKAYYCSVHNINPITTKLNRLPLLQ
jgi:hypothetical protein